MLAAEIKLPRRILGNTKRDEMRNDDERVKKSHLNFIEGILT